MLVMAMMLLLMLLLMMLMLIFQQRLLFMPLLLLLLRNKRRLFPIGGSQRFAQFTLRRQFPGLWRRSSEASGGRRWGRRRAVRGLWRDLLAGDDEGGGLTVGGVVNSGRVVIGG